MIDFEARKKWYLGMFAACIKRARYEPYEELRTMVRCEAKWWLIQYRLAKNGILLVDIM